MPSYIILPNDYLAGVASAMPTSIDQLSVCKGIGAKKLARFGHDLVEQVRLCLAEGLETGVDWPEPLDQQEPQAPAPSAGREGLSDDDLAVIATELRRHMARQLARSLKGRFTQAQLEAALQRLSQPA